MIGDVSNYLIFKIRPDPVQSLDGKGMSRHMNCRGTVCTFFGARLQGISISNQRSKSGGEIGQVYDGLESAEIIEVCWYDLDSQIVRIVQRNGCVRQHQSHRY